MRQPWQTNPRPPLRRAPWLALTALLSILLALAALPALATPVPAPAAQPAPLAPPGHGSPAPNPGEGKPALRPGTIIKMPEGKAVSFEEMMGDLRWARVVYLGESHDNVAHHDNQLAIIKGLECRVSSVAVGMEMFQRPYQDVLDAWTAGRLTPKQFIAKSEWYDRWSMDFSLYEPILVEARQDAKRLLALNAPDELVHAVAANGLSGLPPKQQAQLPTMNLCKPEHRHFIEHMFEGQGSAHHQTSFEHFYEAQRVWDETMAQSVADYLRQPGAAQVVAVICGNGHVEYGLGIPDDVRRRTGAPQRIVSFQEADNLTWGSGPGPAVAMCDYDHPLADYVWVTTSSEEQDRPKLGISVGKQTEGLPGVKVQDVMAGSPAASVGLKAGDVILSVDGEQVGSLGDLRYELSHRKMGDRLWLEVLRGSGKRESFELTLSPIPRQEAKAGMPAHHRR